jgi:hypothetical protein
MASTWCVTKVSHVERPNFFPEGLPISDTIVRCCNLRRSQIWACGAPVKKVQDNKQQTTLHLCVSK